MTRVIRVANATGMRTTRGANAEFSIGKPGLLVVLFGRHEVIFKALGRRCLKIIETPPSSWCRSSNGHSEVGHPPHWGGRFLPKITPETCWSVASNRCLIVLATTVGPCPTEPSARGRNASPPRVQRLRRSRRLLATRRDRHDQRFSWSLPRPRRCVVVCGLRVDQSSSMRGLEILANQVAAGCMHAKFPGLEPRRGQRFLTEETSLARRSTGLFSVVAPEAPAMVGPPPAS
jgi:hypothetical protein